VDESDNTIVTIFSNLVQGKFSCMKINREELIHSLNSLKSGIAKREIIERGDCVIFDVENKIAYSFNELIACIIKVDLCVTGAVIADPLLLICHKNKIKRITRKQQTKYKKIKRQVKTNFKARGV
jgi:hypothetical protein